MDMNGNKKTKKEPRYIDAERLKRSIKYRGYFGYRKERDAQEYICMVIDKQPTAKVTPIKKLKKRE